MSLLKKSIFSLGLSALLAIPASANDDGTIRLSKDSLKLAVDPTYGGRITELWYGDRDLLAVPQPGENSFGSTFWLSPQSLWDWPRRQLTHDRVPVLGFPLDVGFVVSCLVFVGLLYGAWRLVNLPRLADLLIDTELELKKVTWPSLEDCKNSSIVVIGCVAFMLAFLFLCNQALSWFFANVVY